MTSPSTPPVRKSADRILFEEAWAGWLPQMLIVAVLAVEGLLLFFELTGELPLTVTIAVLGWLLPLLQAGRHVTTFVEDARRLRQMWVLLGIAWVSSAAVCLATFFPGPLLLSGELNVLNKVLTLERPASVSQVELQLQAHLKGQGQVGYEVALQTAGGEVPVYGRFSKLEPVAQRGARGQAPPETSHLERREVLVVEGPVSGVRWVRGDSALRGIQLWLRAEWLPPWLPFGVAGVLIGLGAYLDARLSSRHKHTHLTIALTAVTGTFALFFVNYVPEQMLRNLVGSAMVCAIAGVVGGGVLAGLARRVWME